MDGLVVAAKQRGRAANLPARVAIAWIDAEVLTQLLDGLFRRSDQLIALGVLVTVASESESVTSLIPAFIGAGFLLLGIAGTTFTDTTPLANSAYLYKIRAFNGVTESADSNIDLATAVVFTNPGLNAGSSIRGADFTELRAAANALQILAGQMTSPYTDTFLDTTVIVKAVHLNEIKTRINGALTVLGYPLITFANPTAGVTPIAASALLEARTRVQ